MHEYTSYIINPGQCIMGLCMKLKGYIKIRISLQYIYNRQSNEEYIHCLSTRYV